jgi:hypothetical protein
MSQIALELAQNLGRDYHASTEELYYYMRKKDVETRTELMHTIKSIIDKKIKQCESYSKLLLFWQKCFKAAGNL